MRSFTDGLAGEKALNCKGVLDLKLQSPSYCTWD